MAHLKNASDIIHASSVAVEGQAALILGASGSGKSGLALRLMALGALLVADDRTMIQRRDDLLFADTPKTIAGQIEARGVGILAARTAGSTPVRLVVDLDLEESQRLPQFHEIQLLGLTLPLIRRVAEAHFPAAILLYLKGDRLA